MNTYICDLCNNVYEKTKSDEEAYEEFKKENPEMIGEALGFVCAHCNTRIQTWLNSLTKKEKKKMREDMRKKHPELNIM
jgi:redox-regulated HSP33 family molecular chaperone